MKNTGYIILGIVVLFYLYFTIRVQIKIIKTTYLEKNQKIINSVFVWLVPFIWGVMINSLLKNDYSGTITKEKRKIEESHFRESKIGFRGNG